MIKVDTKQLDKFVNHLKKNEKAVQELTKDCTKALAIELLRRTIQKTPRDTSELALRWTDHVTPLDEDAKNVSIYDYLKNADIKQEGNKYTITIRNNVKYAPYVEYGHRIRDGHGWKSGYFMLTLSEREVEQMKDGIISKKVNEFLNKLAHLK